MKLNSTFSIQDKKHKDINNVKDYPNSSEFINVQNVADTHSDYWYKECELHPSNPHCLIYDN